MPTPALFALRQEANRRFYLSAARISRNLRDAPGLARAAYNATIALRLTGKKGVSF